MSSCEGFALCLIFNSSLFQTDNKPHLASTVFMVYCIQLNTITKTMKKKGVNTQGVVSCGGWQLITPPTEKTGEEKKTRIMCASHASLLFSDLLLFLVAYHCEVNVWI